MFQYVNCTFVWPINIKLKNKMIKISYKKELKSNHKTLKEKNKPNLTDDRNYHLDSQLKFNPVQVSSSHLRFPDIYE